MMDLTHIGMEINGKCVELPPDCGLLMNARQGQPVRILVGLGLSMDGPTPERAWCPIPVRLRDDESLTIFHKGQRVFAFVGYRGVAVDPNMRDRLTLMRARRRRRWGR